MPRKAPRSFPNLISRLIDLILDRIIAFSNDASGTRVRVEGSILSKPTCWSSISDSFRRCVYIDGFNRSTCRATSSHTVRRSCLLPLRMSCRAMLQPAIIILLCNTLTLQQTATLTICLIYLYNTSTTSIIDSLRPKSVIPWIRSVVMTLTTLSMYAALKYIPLAEATVVFHLRPMPVAIICYLILGEIFTKIQMTASGMSQ